MPFRFRLEGILKLRQSLEQREELLLQKANLEVARVREEMEGCLRQLAERAASRRAQVSSGAFASELHFELAVEASIEQRRQALGAELKKLEAVRDQQRERYEKARRERETLASIRRREQERYRAQAQRSAQRALDDLMLMRRELLRRG